MSDPEKTGDPESERRWMALVATLPFGTIAALVVYIYICGMSAYFLKLYDWPYIAAIVVGCIVVAIPAFDLENSRAAAFRLAQRLEWLSEEELELFREMVGDRSFESKLDKPPPLSDFDDLRNLLRTIAVDEGWRGMITPPLMQESRPARLGYLHRVWPKAENILRAKAD